MLLVVKSITFAFFLMNLYLLQSNFSAQLFLKLILLTLYLILLNGKSGNTGTDYKDKGIILLHTILPVVNIYFLEGSIINISSVFFLFFGMYLILFSLYELNDLFHLYPFQKDEIVSNGTYSIVRHPIYTGNLVIILANLVSTFSFYPAVIFCVYILLTIARVNIEEFYLNKTLKYQKYKKNVSYKFIPYIY
jgi:protein-S-isoprenylcysteine O-methyltransferase Ste14